MPDLSDTTTAKTSGRARPRPVEAAIEQTYDQPVARVMESMSGRSLEDMRLTLARRLGHPVYEAPHAPADTAHPEGPVCAFSPGGRRLQDRSVDYVQMKVLSDDCLVLAGQRHARPIVSVGRHRLDLHHDHAVPPHLRQRLAGYRIVRPWQLSLWAVRCLCRRYHVHPLRADHLRAQHRGRHQQAVERVFRLPFGQFLANLLFAGEGIDYVTGQPREPADVLSRVHSTVRSVYPHPRMISQRRNLRSTLVRSLMNRSEELTLSFHLRADLPVCFSDHLPD